MHKNKQNAGLPFGTSPQALVPHHSGMGVSAYSTEHPSDLETDIKVLDGHLSVLSDFRTSIRPSPDQTCHLAWRVPCLTNISEDPMHFALLGLAMASVLLGGPAKVEVLWKELFCHFCMLHNAKAAILPALCDLSKVSRVYQVSQRLPRPLSPRYPLTCPTSEWG